MLDQELESQLGQWLKESWRDDSAEETNIARVLAAMDAKLGKVKCKELDSRLDSLQTVSGTKETKRER